MHHFLRVKRLVKSQYSLRSSVDGDETQLAALFNLAHSKYVGFVPRTADYWRWCCRERPDVEKRGIIVAEEKWRRRIVGYAVLGRSGNMWELCVHPDSDRKQVLSALFDRAAEYAKEANIEQMMLNVPEDDLLMQKMCAQLDFSELPADQMFVGITDFDTLVEVLARASISRLGTFKETATFELLNARSWVNPVFSIKVGDGVEVLPEAVSGGLRVKVDSDVLAGILLGITKPTRAFLKGKLRVHPLSKTLKVLRFLEAIQVKDQWFFPLADFG